MKKLYTLAILFLGFLYAQAQTNVSGGIYANTTWTKMNCPYIVTDTVVVFPSVTLTIEPGVVVKFEDHKLLEIRQGQIIAIGTAIDSITFTSNSSSPTPGIWNKIHINGGTLVSQFENCNFEYATEAISNHYLNGTQNSTAELLIRFSKFSYNIRGISCNGNGGGFSTVENSVFHDNVYGGSGAQFIFNNCYIYNNQSGVFLAPYAFTHTFINNSTLNSNHYGIAGSDIGGVTQYSVRNSIIACNTIAGIVEGEYANIIDTVFNCVIKNNPVGILDSVGGGMIIQKCIIEDNIIGLRLKDSNKSLSCNKICNNSLWDIYCKHSFSSNLNVPNNYWCTSDSATISAKIYDGYDNISLSLVNFSPIDTSQCYSFGITNPVDTAQCPISGCILSVSINLTNATCDTCHDGSAIASISYGSSPYTYTWNTSPLQNTQTATGLAPGTYTICAVDANGCTACSNVFIDSTNCTGFAVSAQATNATCSSCSDGTAHVNVTGGAAPYSYTWYTSPLQNTATATGIPQGSYAVCVNDANGCAVCDTVVVSIGNCSAHFNLYPDTVPHNYTAVNMASGVAPLTYLWNWDDGTTSTWAFPSHTYASAGLYSVCLSITDSVGCSNIYCNTFYLMRTTNTMVKVNVVPGIGTGISQFRLPNSAFSIYPNPATNSITITIDETMLGSNVTIIDITGRKLAAVQLRSSVFSLLTSDFANGVYFISLENARGRVTKKLVIQK